MGPITGTAVQKKKRGTLSEGTISAGASQPPERLRVGQKTKEGYICVVVGTVGTLLFAVNEFRPWRLFACTKRMSNVVSGLRLRPAHKSGCVSEKKKRKKLALSGL